MPLEMGIPVISLVVNILIECKLIGISIKGSESETLSH